MPVNLVGWTWGHRRAIAPLTAAAAAFHQTRPDITVSWKIRSLQDFEHQALAELADADLIVFDHPHLGTIVADGLLRPLDDVLANVPGGDDAASYIGPSLDSYRLGGQTWGAPIDAATIHALYRADLMAAADVAVPRTWSDVIDTGHRLSGAGHRMLVAAQGHHGLLTVASLMSNLGQPWPTHRAAFADIDRATLVTALRLFGAALDAADRAASLASNAVAVHEAMTTGNAVALCPAAYGYAIYGRSAPALCFADFPGPGDLPHAGTAIGGGAIGIVNATQHADAAAEFVAFLTTAPTQADILAPAAGQPARRECWATPAGPAMRPYHAVHATLESAWIRPRFAGYSGLEAGMGRTLEAALRARQAPTAIADALLKIPRSAPR